MNTVKVKLSEMKHPERNVRQHSAKQLAEYQRSIQQFGQIRPIVLDENNIIRCGNGLYEALVALGYEEAECWIVTGLTENEKKKLMLADNKIFSLGVDDMSAFDAIIAELAEESDFDIPGFEEDLLKSLTADMEEVDDMMSGYGLVNDTVKASMQRASDSYQRSEQTFAETAVNVTPSPAPNVTDNHQESSENAPVAPVIPTNSYTYTQEELNNGNEHVPIEKRFIICPHCNEKIWL